MSQAAASTARSKKPEPTRDYVNKRKIPSETGAGRNVLTLLHNHN